MTFTNDAMMNKFMDKYESKLNEEVELDEETAAMGSAGMSNLQWLLQHQEASLKLQGTQSKGPEITFALRAI